MLKGGAHCGRFQDLEICLEPLLRVEGGKRNVDCVRRLKISRKLRASCGRPHCILPLFVGTCSSCSSLPNNKICTVTAPQAAAQLAVGCLLFCVMRDKHLSIDRPVHLFASPAAGIVPLFF